MPPKSAPMTGMKMSFTREVTILVKVLPMMTPTAMSITLPRMMNSLNSDTMPFFFSMFLFSLPWDMIQYTTLRRLWLYLFALQNRSRP